MHKSSGLFPRKCGIAIIKFDSSWATEFLTELLTINKFTSTAPFIIHYYYLFILLLLLLLLYWSHISLIIITGEAGGAMSREDFIDNIAVDVLSKLPTLYEIWRVRKQFEMNITPTLVVLLQELERLLLNCIITFQITEQSSENCPQLVLTPLCEVGAACPLFPFRPLIRHNFSIIFRTL